MDVHERRIQLAHRCIDASIVLLLFVAPLVLGGRHAMGRLALMVAALPGTIGLVLKVSAGCKLPLTKWYSVLMLGCLLVPLAQILPVPNSWVHDASPGLTSLFGETPPLVAPKTLTESFSVSAVTTAKSLPLVVAYLSIFTFLLSRLESLADIERLVTLVVGAALMLTVLALLQAGYGNGKFVWLYDHPYRDPGTIPRGPFQNENHLSSLLATALPCALYLIFQPASLAKTSRSKSPSSGGRWLATIACIAIVLTVYATPSRGGAVMIGMAVVLWLAILGWNWLGQRYVAHWSRAHWMTLGIGGGALAIVIALVGLFHEVEKYSYWRAKIWAADIAMWRDFPLLGIGVGNHRHVYRGYVDEYWFQTFSTGESSWLQILVETGAVGAAWAVLIVAIILGSSANFIRQHTGKRLFLLGAAILAGLTVSFVHAAGDFPWHIPACFFVVLVLAAIALRLPQLVGGKSDPLRGGLSPMLSAALGLALLCGQVWSIHETLPEARAARSWDQYKRLVRDQAEGETEETERMAELVAETLREDPYHLSARMSVLARHTAALEKQRFELDDPQPAAKDLIRQSAAIAALCPTESKPYLCAAIALNVLNAPLTQQQRLLAQAQRLRPIDGQIALRRGLNALVMQDQDLVQEQFAIALEIDPSNREQAVRAISLLYPMEQILERWQPSRETAAVLFQQVRGQSQLAQQQLVGRYYYSRLREDAQQSAATEDRIRLLDAAMQVAAEIDDDALLLEIVTQRLGLEPNSVAMLLARAQIHYRAGQLTDAQADVQRCARIAPRDERVRQLAFRLDREAARKR